MEKTAKFDFLKSSFWVFVPFLPRNCGNKYRVMIIDKVRIQVTFDNLQSQLPQQQGVLLY